MSNQKQVDKNKKSNFSKQQNKENILLKDFKPKSMLQCPSHIPQKAKYPVIDTHNHLFGELPAKKMIEIMDQAGVKVFVNVSGNVSLPFDEKGYTIKRLDFQDFVNNYISKFPDRFLGFTMSDFAQWDDFVIFKDDGFVDMVIQHLEEDVEKGAAGLKVTKELGLGFKDKNGAMVRVDDQRLYPVWKRAGELKIPALMHISDPEGFFLPADRYNEHYLSLQKFPGWSFYGSYFSKKELLKQRNKVIADHPQTTFICPHIANYAEDLDYVAGFLDDYPNTYIDFSARIDELGRQPYRARDFMIKYQDRILFGTDIPISVEAYRCYFRFLETADEYFDYPDYMGTWTYTRWKIYGLYLPDEVLRKIYYENALRIVPGIKGF